MSVFVEWTGDITGLDLKPTWEVEEVSIHTVKNMLQPDGKTKQDTLVAYFNMTSKQMNKLFNDYGRHSFSISVLGIDVIPLYPNAILWVWKAPKGYENAIKDGTYTAFRIKQGVAS